MKKQLKNDFFLWFLFFLITSFLYQIIQDHRNNLEIESQLLTYLLGVAPNFLASISISSFFIIIIPFMSKKIHGLDVLFYSIIITTTGLLIWEFLQLYTSKGFFDINDILWTIIGIIIFPLRSTKPFFPFLITRIRPSFISG